MWKNKLKEIIYILENSNVNEIEVSFWWRKFRVSKQPTIVSKGETIQEFSSSVPHQEPIKEGASSEAPETTPKGEELLSPMPVLIILLLLRMIFHLFLKAIKSSLDRLYV